MGEDFPGSSRIFYVIFYLILHIFDLFTGLQNFS